MTPNYISSNSIFNPTGDDNPQNRTIIQWNTTWLFNLNDVKYNRAKGMYTIMLGNFRVPEKVKGLGEDSVQYQKGLSDAERRAYDGILSFLIFLDSIQTVNLPHFSDYITAPEINLLLSIQAYQEAIHSQSYATILETVVDQQKRQDIYYFWRDDKILLERNKYIGGLYQSFMDHPNEQNLFKWLVANYLLEWLYFYNGFAFFDTLADHQKMRATQRMISYIRRDELTHVTLFANILKEIKREFSSVRDGELIYDMTKIAVEQEIQRSHHILWDQIIWINWKNTETYTKRLANERLILLGLKPLYDWVKNPYTHLDRLQDSNMEKWNFFESTVTNYTQSHTLQGDREF